MYEPWVLDPKPKSPKTLNPKPKSPKTLNPKPKSPKTLNPKPKILDSTLKSPKSPAQNVEAFEFARLLGGSGGVRGLVGTQRAP